MSGLPVVCSNLYELKNIIEDYNCGWIIEENSDSSFEKVINTITSEDINLKASRLKEVAEVYCWEMQEKVLIEGYASLQASEV
jgi:glycosyltransferase involved in cell wall biosynthesis